MFNKQIYNESLNNGWTKSKLKFHLKINNGREISEEVSSENKEAIPVYGSGGIFKYTNKKLYCGESVLFGRKGTIGKPLFVDEGFWTVDTMYFTSFNKESHSKFFYYLFCVFPWESITTQTALPSIVGTEVADFECLIPEKLIQERISEYLDVKSNEINSLIENKKRLIRLLEEKRQSIITEAVTKGLNPNVKMKDSGVEWIGEIPEHWELQVLKRNLIICNGREIETELDRDTENAINVYGSGGVFKRTDKPLYEGESVLFGRKGTIGKPLYVNEKFWAVDTMYYSRFYQQSLPKFFYYLLLVFPWDLITTHTALPSVVGTDVGNSMCAIPQYQEQKLIVEKLDEETLKIDETINITKIQIQKLTEYRQALIYEVVTGKNDVRELVTET